MEEREKSMADTDLDALWRQAPPLGGRALASVTRKMATIYDAREKNITPHDRLSYAMQLRYLAHRCCAMASTHRQKPGVGPTVAESLLDAAYAAERVLYGPSGPSVAVLDPSVEETDDMATLRTWARGRVWEGLTDTGLTDTGLADAAFQADDLLGQMERHTWPLGVESHVQWCMDVLGIIIERGRRAGVDV